LIDEITEAAHEAIEQAAGEAAKAAVLALLEREAEAMREATKQQAEAMRWQIEAEINKREIEVVRKTGRKNTFIGTAIGVFSGLALGIGGLLIIGSATK
jgi:transcription antitermination factor NusA-like protein